MARIKDGFDGQRALVLPKSVIRYMEKDTYTSMLHITDIGYYPKALYHFRRRDPVIDQNILIYCVEGCGWFEFEQEKFTVNSNEYFILPAGFPHAYGSDPNNPWTIYWLHFKGSIASNFVNQQVKPYQILPEKNSRISERTEFFEEIFHTLEMGYSHKNISYACSVFHHYLGTLRFMQQYRDAGTKAAEKDDAILYAIHYMKENMEKKISLDELSAHVGYSIPHFSTLFKKRTGCSPFTYFNQLKIQHACHLLDFTDMKINQVCYKIGIDDPYYFSRLFSKVMGMSPRDYKQKKKG